MDQSSNGFNAVRPGAFVASPNVTGRLDEELRSIGENATCVWRLNPEIAAVVHDGSSLMENARAVGYDFTGNAVVARASVDQD